MKAKRRGQGRVWEQWANESPTMPTHPEILKRLRVEYPQTKDELTLCIAEYEAFFETIDQHFRSI